MTQRHPIAWQSKDFWDKEKLDAEMVRVFDICHGCRRCFNLCDSFPQLFDLVDNSSSEELDTVNHEDFHKVVDECTMCDMCFINKCPYVPPHEFQLDFPHLMLRYRMVYATESLKDQMLKIDRNGRLFTKVSAIVNWGIKNKFARKMLQVLAGIDTKASLPLYAKKQYIKMQPLPKTNNPLRKAALYVTCLANYNQTELARAAELVLTHNNVEVKIIYPGCCGMPLLENGKIHELSDSIPKVAKELANAVDAGYKIVSIVPSCSLMLKSEWLLLFPDNPDILKISQNAFDLAQYINILAKEHLLKLDFPKAPESISIHIPCHARAQNIGSQGAEMLKLLPKTKVDVIERCSGHGGSWGVMQENHQTALKIGKPVFDKLKEIGNKIVVSECPLAGLHIVEGCADNEFQVVNLHPIQILAHAYGLC